MLAEVRTRPLAEASPWHATTAREGCCELELEPGDWRIFGVSTDGSCSIPVDIALARAERRTVELDFQFGSVLTAIVCDEVDGHRIDGATITIESIADAPTHLDSSRTTRASSNSQGRFELAGPAGQAVTLRVGAIGYRDLRLATQMGAGVLTDVGLIALSPEGRLVVELRGADPTQHTSYRVGLAHTGELQPFEPDGRAILTCPAGDEGVEVAVFHPHEVGTVIGIEGRVEDHSPLIVDVDGEASLLVATSRERREGTGRHALVNTRSPSGHLLQWSAPLREGRAELAGLPAGLVRVSLFEADEAGVLTWIAAEDVTLLRSQQALVRFDDPRGPARLRILDSTGTPLAGAQLGLGQLADPTDWGIVLEADAAGHLDVPRIAGEGLVLRGADRAGRILADLPIGFDPTREDTYTLTLGPPKTLDIALTSSTRTGRWHAALLITGLTQEPLLPITLTADGAPKRFEVYPGSSLALHLTSDALAERGQRVPLTLDSNAIPIHESASLTLAPVAPEHEVTLIEVPGGAQRTPSATNPNTPSVRNFPALPLGRYRIHLAGADRGEVRVTQPGVALHVDLH